MAKRVLQLGDKHWHNLFGLTSGQEHITPHRRAELAITRIMNKTIQLNFVRSLHVICEDEFGQQSAEYMATYDILLRHVRKSNVHMGGMLILGTMDHMQIQPLLDN
uniref:Uncharacterized protein n=1 Tax=Eucampia antarctica TaxID=49252 RepID=A0A7S2S6V5_9STRA